MDEINELTAAPKPPAHVMTGRQRNVAVICRSIANDMDVNGTVAEQHTSALLHLLVDAVERGYEAGLVAVAREWGRGAEGIG